MRKPEIEHGWAEDVKAAAAGALAIIPGARKGGLLSRPVGSPLPVYDPTGTINSWFVPITAAKLLIGFVQLDRGLRFQRFSTFARREGSLDGVPEAASWLDPERIRNIAMLEVGPDADVGRPALTYDGSPMRLAWAVPIIRQGKSNGTVMVAAPAVWYVAETVLPNADQLEQP